MWATTDKEYIIKTLDQVHIFSVFLNIPEDEIIRCTCVRNYKISNPLRYDPNPSVGFRWYGDKLIMRDFADYKFRGDVFEIVGIVLKKNCNNNIDFTEICSAIIEHASDKMNDTAYIFKVHNSNIKAANSDFKSISTELRDFTFYDYRYFNQFGITNDLIDKFVKCVNRFTIDGITNPYYYTRKDPCYQYQIQTNAIKLYFPFRNKKMSNRFITNNKCPLEEIQTIAMTDYKLLIKSQKDKMLLYRILRELNITNVGVHVISSETAKLPNDIVQVLKDTTHNKIFVLFDTDTTGINSANEYKANYNFYPLFFTKGYPAKDPTDLVRMTSYEFVKDKFKNMYLNDIINAKD
ncbi:MAG: hypothetical protein HDQ88_04775 [Clostridia bacterium]|nr:hypothetical protein [Clostridia bacterium]